MNGSDRSLSPKLEKMEIEILPCLLHLRKELPQRLDFDEWGDID